MTDSRSADGGYILVSVLSVVALLSGLVLATLLLARTATDTVRTQTGALTDEALATAAVNLAGYELFVLKHDAATVSGRQLRMDQGLITLTVSSDAGKADLNGSGRGVLSAAYRASGLTTLTPEVFAARVMDWRDGDDTTQENGAEADAYESDGLTYRPRNAPFRSVSDLRYVLGVSTDDIVRLQPFVTVYNAPGRLSIRDAAPALILALPDVKAATAKQVIELRSDPNDINIAKIADLLLVQSALVEFAAPRTYSLTVETHRIMGNARHIFNVVIAAGATQERPFEVLNWAALHFVSSARQNGG